MHVNLDLIRSDVLPTEKWNLTIQLSTFQVITYGATITSIQVPNKKGVPDDVVAGFDTLEGLVVSWL